MRPTEFSVLTEAAPLDSLALEGRSKRRKTSSPSSLLLYTLLFFSTHFPSSLHASLHRLTGFYADEEAVLLLQSFRSLVILQLRHHNIRPPRWEDIPMTKLQSVVHHHRLISCAEKASSENRRSLFTWQIVRSLTLLLLSSQKRLLLFSNQNIITSIIRRRRKKSCSFFVSHSRSRWPASLNIYILVLTIITFSIHSWIYIKYLYKPVVPSTQPLL